MLINQITSPINFPSEQYVMFVKRQLHCTHITGPGHARNYILYTGVLFWVNSVLERFKACFSHLNLKDNIKHDVDN